MRRLTDLLSKPIISLYEGKTEGTIKNVIFSKDLKILKWLVLFDDQEILEQKFLPAKEIFNVGENAVVIKNNICIVPNIASLNEPIQNNPINHSIYTVGGNLLDKVSDVILDEKNTVQFLELKNGTQLLLSQIAVSGQDTLILQDEQNPIRINNFKQRNFPKMSKERTTQKVKIMSTEEPVLEKPITEEPVLEKPITEEPVLEKPITEEPVLEKPITEEIKLEEKVEEKIKEVNTEQKILPIIEKETTQNQLEDLMVQNIVPQEEQNKETQTQEKTEENFDDVRIEEQPNDVKTEVEEKKEQPATKTIPFKKEFSKLIKPKNKKTKTVVTMEEKKVEKQTVKKIKPSTFNEITARPTRILSNNNFLLNRSATKNVYTHYQELIIKAGEKITSKEINKAFLCGKLQELIRNSK